VKKISNYGNSYFLSPKFNKKEIEITSKTLYFPCFVVMENLVSGK
jgi:hypothetical protein